MNGKSCRVVTVIKQNLFDSLGIAMEVDNNRLVRSEELIKSILRQRIVIRA